MKTFDERWKRLTDRARAAAGAPPDEAAAEPPPGFATRVLARARAESPEVSVATAATAGGEWTVPLSATDSEDLWLGWARLGLAFMAAIVLVLGAAEIVSRNRSPGLAHPAIENSIAQILWRL